MKTIYIRNINIKIKRQPWLLLSCWILMFFLFPASLSAKETTQWPVSRTGFFFDTVVTISLFGPPEKENVRDPSGLLLDECFDLMSMYDAMLSKTREGSDIWNINHAGGETVTVSEETADLIRTALSVC